MSMDKEKDTPPRKKTPPPLPSSPPSTRPLSTRLSNIRPSASFMSASRQDKSRTVSSSTTPSGKQSSGRPGTSTWPISRNLATGGSSHPILPPRKNSSTISTSSNTLPKNRPVSSLTDSRKKNKNSASQSNSPANNRLYMNTGSPICSPKNRPCSGSLLSSSSHSNTRPTSGSASSSSSQLTNHPSFSSVSSSSSQPKNRHSSGSVSSITSQPNSQPIYDSISLNSQPLKRQSCGSVSSSCSQPKTKNSKGKELVRKLRRRKSHKFCGHCHTCKEGNENLTFGRMGQVIPDPLQMWISSHLLCRSLDSIAKGLNGFDELKKYIRQGSDLCKEVAFIIQERAELESTYSKGLSKISSKLVRATQNSIGSLVEGWRAVATEMDVEADLHKNLAAALLDDIAKPLKQLVEAQHKARKPVESAVDKALKSLTDKRTEENKAKKSSYDSAKSHEKMEESKPGKNKTEKDINKIEKKQKQLLDSLRKADKHYCECCEKSEVARQEWDFSVNKASQQLQVLEEERINKMNDYLTQYSSHLSVLGPRLTQCCDSLHKCVVAVDLSSDITNAAKQRGTGQYTPEQILIDSYAEDRQFSLKDERRKAALQHYLWHLRQSIEREQKGREGVEKLVEVYRERPNFADPDAQEEAQQKLGQVISMTNFLEANHFKMATFLAELDRSNKPAHKFAKYIEQTRDKQGMNVSVLKLPLHVAVEGHTGYDVNNVTIGALASDEPFYDDDEFDDDPVTDSSSHRVNGRCRALFDYQASQSDELAIMAGDMINIYDRQPDGWWQGELNGRVGMFPATYVEEI